MFHWFHDRCTAQLAGRALWPVTAAITTNGDRSRSPPFLHVSRSSCTLDRTYGPLDFAAVNSTLHRRLSWQDIVLAPFISQEEFATFTHVVQKSGNRTVRINFKEAVAVGNQTDAVLTGLGEIGCSYEGMGSFYMSINIPSTVELAKVSAYLTEQNCEWEYADPTYASLYPDGV